MSMRYQLRSTSLDAHFAMYGKYTYGYNNLGLTDFPAIQNNAASGVFGGKVINMVPTSVVKGLSFPGNLNLGAVDNNGALSVRIRLVPTQTLSPFTGYGILATTGTIGLHGFGFRMGIGLTGLFYIQLADAAGNVTTFTGTNAVNSTVDVPFDAMITWSGALGTGVVKCSINGVEHDTINVTTPSGVACTNRKVLQLNASCTGVIPAGPTALKANLNDLTIWDTQENHVYTPRTDFDNIPAYDALAIKTYSKSRLVNI